MSGTFGYEHVPGRIQALWSVRVGSWIRVLGLSGPGLWSPGNENTPLRTMRSRAPTILLLTLTRMTAKRCTVALGVITRSDRPDR